MLTLYLASGCFWGREFHLRQLSGVVTTRTGFAGGHTADPTYRQVCSEATGHAEVVEVVYDPAMLSTRSLLTEFFTLHDATVDRSGKGGKGQYRSAIFYLADDDSISAPLRTAYAVVDELNVHGYAVSTKIRPIAAFYPAEPRHQQYCAARGMRPKKRDAASIREILTKPGGKMIG